MAAARAALAAWASGCIAVALVFGTALALIAPPDFVLCRDELRRVPEPADWRAWPVLADLGGYGIEGKRVNCVGHGLQCGLAGTELRNKRLCPRSGVSLDAWFNGSIYQSKSDIHLRGSKGTFVVSGHEAIAEEGGTPATPAEERFVVAFREPAAIAHPAFERLGTEMLSLTSLGAIVGVAVAGARARRLLTRAEGYRDGTRYKVGHRDGSGAIVFADGLPSLASSGAPGPVLVRVSAITAGTYRDAPATTAHEIVEGELDVVCERLHGRAATTLRTACLACFAVGVTLVVCTGVAMLSAVLESLAQE
jgi:hypothetical protein